MKYFLDTKFCEDGRIIDLLSIGIVAEDGRELYLQNEACHFEKANEWVVANVFPHLHGFTWQPDGVHISCSDDIVECAWVVPVTIRRKVSEFVVADKQIPQWWGYFSAYDWVVLCQLYGPMVEIPKGWPYYCRDLRQWLDDHGLQHVKQPDDAPHHALLDARWIRETWVQYVKDSQP